MAILAFPSQIFSLQTSPSPSKMLPPSAYDTILNGKIATVPNFISPALTASLRADAKELYDSGYFSADALAAYGTNVSLSKYIYMFLPCSIKIYKMDSNKMRQPFCHRVALTHQKIELY